MIYGLCGASGSGKTTLATMVADSMSLTFLKTSITDSAKRHGYDPVARLSLNDRVDLQFHLLNDMLEMIENAERPAILDRTPIDMIGYMLCEFHMHSHKDCDPQILKKVDAYVDACYRSTQMFFDHVFYLCRLENYEEAPTRPALNPAYQTHYETVLRGALSSMDGLLNFSLVNVTDINKRVDHLNTVIERRLDHFDRFKRNARHVN